jgi:4-amino-4-deoxy-L-arabinose transferase-like glycosyltransferase
VTTETVNLRLRMVWYVFAVLLAVFTYFYGLDSDHIPKNGDEYPYAHITRLTADSGRLLPLQSQMNQMRNTKPPLLFWQGIVSTGWGKNWTRWNLRYPNVVYTLLTAGLVLLLARRLSGQWETGFAAMLAYLAFFDTYRYGRPFLTNPPEVFWLFLPFFSLLYWRDVAFNSRLLFPLLLGLAIGIGLLYKSFVLIVPVGLGLAWWYLHHRRYHFRTFIVKDSWKVGLMAAIALGVFGLWFLLDPDPQAILKEFILGENVGKMSAHGRGYLSQLLWGGSSVWSLALTFLVNAGLLAFPLGLLLFMAIRDRALLTDKEKLLWIWVVTFFLVFSLPSQRSGRYLLDVMPAVAVLLALNWQRISRAAFIVTLSFAGLIFAVGGYLSVELQLQADGGALYPPVYWLFLAGAFLLTLAAICIPRLTRPMVAVVVILTLVAFAAFMRPLDGTLGNFATESQQYAKGKDVWVPCNFRAKDEEYRFILPGAEVHGYKDVKGLESAGLSSSYPLYVMRMPLTQKPDLPGFRVIGERLNMRSRHSNSELKEMIFGGKLFQLLFVREYLIAGSPGPGFTPPPDACR